MSSAAYVFLFVYPPTTGIYTLSLHDALPILEIAADQNLSVGLQTNGLNGIVGSRVGIEIGFDAAQMEEHTSELQSHVNLVCRLLLEKKNLPVRYRLN